MQVESQIEDNEKDGDDDTEPNDKPGAIKPKILAVSVKFAWLRSVGEQVELFLAPVQTRHVNICLTSSIAFGPMSLFGHGSGTTGGEHWAIWANDDCVRVAVVETAN